MTWLLLLLVVGYLTWRGPAIWRVANKRADRLVDKYGKNVFLAAKESRLGLMDVVDNDD